MRRTTMPTVLTIAAPFLAFAHHPEAARAQDAIYPQGKRFPLVLYSLHNGNGSECVLATEDRVGWNAAHAYTSDIPTTSAFLVACANQGMLVLTNLGAACICDFNECQSTNLCGSCNCDPKCGDCCPDPPCICDPVGFAGLCPDTTPTFQVCPGDTHYVPFSNSKVCSDIGTLASGPVSWWNVPEEMRFYRCSEMGVVIQYAQQTRNCDPLQRPNYLWLQSSALPAELRCHVPYVDVIPAGVYPKYQRQPYAWTRWRMETTVNGILQAGAPIGPNYLAGEKTPVANLELFLNPCSSTSPCPNRCPNGSSCEVGGGPCPDGSMCAAYDPIATPQGAYYNFWQSIVSGAQGILVFSYYHRNDHPNLLLAWERYKDAAREITGPEQLGDVILYGETVETVGTVITSGPGQTVAFTPYGAPEVSYESIDVLVKVWNGNTYVFAVNSVETPSTVVEIRVTGLPASANEATVLNGTSGTIPVAGGELNLAFLPLQVHILKVAGDPRQPIPAVSRFGIAVIAMLLMSAAALIIRQRAGRHA